MQAAGFDRRSQSTQGNARTPSFAVDGLIVSISRSEACLTASVLHHHQQAGDHSPLVNRLASYEN